MEERSGVGMARAVLPGFIRCPSSWERGEQRSGSGMCLLNLGKRPCLPKTSAKTPAKLLGTLSGGGRRFGGQPNRDDGSGKTRSLTRSQIPDHHNLIPRSHLFPALGGRMDRRI